MIYKNDQELFNNDVFTEEDGQLIIKDESSFRNKIIDDIVHTIVCGESAHIKRLCYWIAYSAGLHFKVTPSSIQGLYEARGLGKVSGFTTPAINLRMLTYDLARAIFRSSMKINAGAFIFEIAKSEIGYTDQRPLEYVSILILAAIKEGYSGPIFIQGDHFQVKAANYLKDKDKEITPLRDLIKESVDAGFYNIDIDSSTLVDLSKETIDEQQKNNYDVCAYFTKFIRGIQPSGIHVSVGGEIGEVGGKNSTPEEFHAFMKGYRNETGDLKGISKMSVQTGTSHGGVVLPDGSIAKVKIDFDTLKDLSRIAREEYGISGCVQHGASTLPKEAFNHFTEVGCSEIHLATQFQNIVYDYLPGTLKEEIYAWLKENCANERKSEQTDDQFIYKTRKKALGPFKKEIFELNQDLKDKIAKIMEEEFDFLFSKLAIKNTKEVVEEFVPPIVVEKGKSDFLKEEKDLGTLEGAD